MSPELRARVAAWAQERGIAVPEPRPTRTPYEVQVLLDSEWYSLHAAFQVERRRARAAAKREAEIDAELARNGWSRYPGGGA